MAIPNAEKTKAAMLFLLAHAKTRPHEIVHEAALRKAAGFTELESRFFLNTLFQTGLLQLLDPTRFFVKLSVLRYEQRMFACTFPDVHSFAQGIQARSRLQRILPILLAAKSRSTDPTLTLKAILEFDGKNDDGRLIRSVAIPWFQIMRMIESDPEAIYQIDPYKWEEIIAGAYSQAGFDEVVLTPRSGDNGRDVVATKKGVGSIRIFDQVKAYKPGNLVTAVEVRALAGTIFAAGNVSKGVITTTSDFAPRIETHDFIKNLIPYRIELKNRDTLLQWLSDLSRDDPDET